jgi:uncharacterized protein (DUF885 family)
LLTQAEQIDTGPLNAQERATLALIKRELAGLRAQHAADSWQRPWLFPAGPDFTAMFWANSSSIGDAAAAALYVDRLAGLPAYLRDVQTNIEAGHARGYRYPRVVLHSAAANTRGILGAAPEASAWLSPFKRSAAAAQSGVQAQAERALGVVRDALQPALQAWADFLESLVQRGARESLSCVDGPAGAAYYCTWVQHFTSTTNDPEEVHALGLAEVARLEREIEAVAGDAGYAGNVSGYRAFLASDPQFVAPSRDALRESIEALCKRVDRRIPEFFGLIPRITYGVQSIPDAVSTRMPPAYAQPSPADGTSAGIFWISGLPSKAPNYLHPALVVHEAWPGHLMHLALLNERTELPVDRVGVGAEGGVVGGEQVHVLSPRRREGGVEGARHRLRRHKAERANRRRCRGDSAAERLKVECGIEGAERDELADRRHPRIRAPGASKHRALSEQRGDRRLHAP